MPVMKHYHGICTSMWMPDVDPDMAIQIILNAKVQRPGVCNAAETLLVHREVAPTFCPGPPRPCSTRESSFAATPSARTFVPDMVPRRARPTGIPSTSTRSWPSASSTRSTTRSPTSRRHGSGHTETIVTSDLAAARRFVAEVDSSAVMVNASTRFNDGGQLGLGAEIGISTDKYHARAPAACASSPAPSGSSSATARSGIEELRNPDFTRRQTLEYTKGKRKGRREERSRFRAERAFTSH